MHHFDHLSDEDLAQKSLEDVAFFEELMRRYEQKLMRYILRISHFCPQTAEEILQDVFLKVWKNINNFDASVKFSSWIYRITHNETISLFRKFRARGEDQKMNLDEELFLPSKVDFIQDLDQEFSAQKIHQILDLMKSKYREVLVLKFLEEKSYEEISDILQKPDGTVATLINRAKEQFRELASRHNISFS